jgi:DNA-binding PadR family transcriptional regulator
MMHDLVLLGILADGPMHGYEVCKEIDQKLGALVGVRPRSVYYSLDKLEKQGFLASRSARTGNRPKKFIYRLTKEGRRELGRLLFRNILLVERPFLNLDLSLYFLKHIDVASFARALTKRVEFLKTAARWGCNAAAGEHGTESEECIRKIIEHDNRILREEIRFTRQLLSELEQAAART